MWLRWDPGGSPGTYPHVVGGISTSRDSLARTDVVIKAVQSANVVWTLPLSSDW